MNKITNHMPTDQLQALDAAHHLHPFMNNADLAQTGARVITSANGVTLTDSNGETLLDAMAGLWCVNIGYGRDELAEVAAAQMRQLPYYNTFFQTTHPPAIALSAKLAQLAPDGFNSVFYCSSGSEANDTNMRLVRLYWAQMGKPNKTTIISRHNAYHGSTMAGMSLSGLAAMHEQGGIINGVAHIEQPYWYKDGGDMSPDEFGLHTARALERKIAELGEDNVAAFIAEPIQGAGGVIMPPDTYWPEIQRICDAHEILLIADEVICGFGRTGAWWGCDTFNIRPDIITIAKGLSSGYAPIGGSLVNDKVADVIKNCTFNHGYTYSAHPVAAAVALENLRIIEEEKLIEKANATTIPYLRDKWLGLADHPLVEDPVICGLMGSIALTPKKGARAGFEQDWVAGTMCRDFCFAGGLVMRRVVDRMIISPPLILRCADVDVLIERAVKALDLTHAELKKQGMMNGER